MAFQKILVCTEIMLITAIAYSSVVNIKNNTTVNYHVLDYILLLHYDVNIILDFDENVLLGDCNIIIFINYQTKNIIINPMSFTIFKIILIDYFNNTYIPYYSFINIMNALLLIEFTNMSYYPNFILHGRFWHLRVQTIKSVLILPSLLLRNMQRMM